MFVWVWDIYNNNTAFGMTKIQKQKQQKCNNKTPSFNESGPCRNCNSPLELYK